MTPKRSLFTTLFACTLLAAPVAHADEADKAACAALEEGDGCTRGNGDPGICIPDESDPDVLTCDDDGLGSNAGDDGGCNIGGTPASGGAWLAGVALALVAAARRRRG
jgi:MYXO-CTERM domain-containing protein